VRKLIVSKRLRTVLIDQQRTQSWAARILPEPRCGSHVVHLTFCAAMIGQIGRCHATSVSYRASSVANACESDYCLATVRYLIASPYNLRTVLQASASPASYPSFLAVHLSNEARREWYIPSPGDSTYSASLSN
jgi:hypothetical protein